MFFGIIQGLLVGWLLSLFNFNDIVLNALQPFANAELGMDIYYMIFAFIGILYVLIKENH